MPVWCRKVSEALHWRWLRLVFSLGLLLGQTAAVVHATSHQIAPDRDASCQLCAAAHGAGGTPAPLRIIVATSFLLPPAAPVPESVCARLTLVCPPGTGPPRGPL
jgi:hypothetical protein